MSDARGPAPASLARRAPEIPLMAALPQIIWTIGHSTRPMEQFLGLLAASNIELLADVRAHPGSRRFPQFGSEPLAASLRGARIEYVHLPELGGRRRPRPDSHNTAWRNASFRGYADYTETEQFARALPRLERLAAARRTALMCAEALWWQCHRGLIADALKARGWRVLHIERPGKDPEEHPYTSAARPEGDRVSYRAGDGQDGLFPAK